jgi:prephenate dehydrogenase
MAAERIAILGFGRFGRALAELCVEAGFDVRAHDPGASTPRALAASSVRELAMHADIMIIAVPVPAMRSALLEVAPHLASSQLVLDVGSVKGTPIEVMRSVLGARIPHAGTHPLFGPTSLALGDRPLRVIVCPNPLHPSAAARASDFYRKLGCEVIEQDAEAHDRAMAETHALAFFIAKGLLDAGAGRAARFAPPSFQAMARTIEAVRSDAGHLFLAIQRENPYAGAARKRLVDALANIDEQLSSGVDAGEASGESTLDIPDLGSASPALRETRDLIDEIDRELCDLLSRRAKLSQRAAKAKADEGRLAVRDAERERALLAARAEWARERGLSPEAVRDVFEAVLRFSRAVQREEHTDEEERR